MESLLVDTPVPLFRLVQLDTSACCKFENDSRAPWLLGLFEAGAIKNLLKCSNSLLPTILPVEKSFKYRTFVLQGWLLRRSGSTLSGYSRTAALLERGWRFMDMHPRPHSMLSHYAFG